MITPVQRLLEDADRTALGVEADAVLASARRVAGLVPRRDVEFEIGRQVFRDPRPAGEEELLKKLVEIHGKLDEIVAYFESA
jgi:hypothetical protein